MSQRTCMNADALWAWVKTEAKPEQLANVRLRIVRALPPACSSDDLGDMTSGIVDRVSSVCAANRQKKWARLKASFPGGTAYESLPFEHDGEAEES